MERHCIAFLLFCAAVGLLQAQAPPALKEHKNSLSLFYYINHYFDESRTNWTFVVPSRKRIYEPDGTMYVKDTYAIPVHVGAQYIYAVTLRDHISVSASVYYLWYLKDLYQPGEVYERNFVNLSLGYLRHLIGQGRVRLYALGDLNFRTGSESIHIYYPNSWESRSALLALDDLGLGCGLRVVRLLPLNLQCAFEARYTRYVLLRDKGVDFFGQHKGPTPHALSLQWGIGFRFGKSPKP